MRRLRSLGGWSVPIAALVLAGTLAASSAPAYAEGDGDGCNPGRSPATEGAWPAGAIQNESSIGGVQSSIYDYSPYVSSSDGTGVGSWVMLANGSDWAQIGWYEQPDSVRGTIVQLTQNGTPLWTNYDKGDSDAINTWSTYKVTYSSSGPNYFSFYLDGNGVTSSQRNVFTPNQSQLGAEIHNYADQFPGGSNNHEQFTSSETYWPNGSGGSWKTYSGSGSAVPYSFMNISPGSGNPVSSDLNTWDSACTN